MASAISAKFTQPNSSVATIDVSKSSLLTVHFIIGLLDTILLPAGVILNIIAIIVFIHHVNRKPTVHFLRSLALSDILIPVSILLLHAFREEKGCFGFGSMHFFMYLGAVTINAVLALVSEQLVKLIFPGREVFDKTRTVLALVVLWFLPAIVVYIIPLVYYSVRYNHFESVISEDYTFCQYLRTQSLFIDEVVVRVWVAYCFIALAAIFVMYILLYVNIRKLLGSSSSTEGIRDEQAIQDAKARNEMMKITILLLLCLVVFWGPILVCWIIVTSWSERVYQEHLLLWQFITLFTLLNPIVDPIIVIARMPDVRKGFREICCCCCIHFCWKRKGNLEEEKTVMYTKTANTQIEAAEIEG